MNFVKNLNQFNKDYIYFCEPIKNNIMNEGTFIRILYSTHYVVFNGIYLLLGWKEPRERIIMSMFELGYFSEDEYDKIREILKINWRTR